MACSNLDRQQFTMTIVKVKAKIPRKRGKDGESQGPWQETLEDLFENYMDKLINGFCKGTARAEEISKDRIKQIDEAMEGHCDPDGGPLILGGTCNVQQGGQAGQGGQGGQAGQAGEESDEKSVSDKIADFLRKWFCGDPPEDPGSVSPLLLDLDGDGVEADGLAFFDHAGDGFAELGYSMGDDDAMLVMDRNGDGVINDGSELFGEHTVLADGSTASDGFAALSDLDTNGDGMVSSLDADWGSLRLLRWVDSDGDGATDSAEMQALSSHGIASLGTQGTVSSHVDSKGNEHRLVGSFTKSDGATGTMSDVWLRTDESLTVYSGSGIPGAQRGHSCTA